MSLHSRRARVGIFHSTLGRGAGGAESAALWAIEALKRDHDLTVITARPIDLDALNAFYGTRVAASDFKLRIVPSAPGRPRIRGALAKALFERKCQQCATEFDVPLSSSNPIDFGVPGIHVLANLCWDERLRRETGFVATPRRVMPFRALARGVYQWTVGRVQRSTGRDLFSGEDIILANSDWTAGILNRCFPNESVETLYPPVWGDYPPREHASREVGFVSLGRLAPSKKVDRAIEILARVRSLGHDVHLHVIGDVGQSDFSRSILALQAKHADWVHLEGRQVGAAKERILTGHQFGLHASTWEYFGIAVAEMCKAGTIPFVFHEGGPAGIVNHSALCYRDIDDAVDKIDRVLRDDGLRQALHEHVLRQGQRFSSEEFMRGIRRAVEKFLGIHGRRPLRGAA